MRYFEILIETQPTEVIVADKKNICYQGYQKNGLGESARIDETVIGYHGSRAGDPVFKIGHSGNNAHTFGAYDSQRYGAFFSDNPKFAALYGNVKKYVLNIHDTADLNTPHIRQEFIESLDPFG